MKRILCILIVCSQDIYAMPQEQPSSIRSCITQLTSLIRKKSSLTEHDLSRASQIIKEIRALSPSSAFACKEKLKERIIDQNIETDSGLMQPMRSPKEILRRAPSPLTSTTIIS